MTSVRLSVCRGHIVANFVKTDSVFDAAVYTSSCTEKNAAQQ